LYGKNSYWRLRYWFGERFRIMSSVWAQSGEILRCQDDRTKIAADNQCPCIGAPLKCFDKIIPLPDSFLVDILQTGRADCCGSTEGGDNQAPLTFRRFTTQQIEDCFGYPAWDEDTMSLYFGPNAVNPEAAGSWANRQLQDDIGNDFCGFDWATLTVCCVAANELQIRLDMLSISQFAPVPDSLCEGMADCYGAEESGCQRSSTLPTCNTATINAVSTFVHNEPDTTDWLSFDKTYDEEFPSVVSFSSAPAGSFLCNWEGTSSTAHPIMRLSAA